MIGVGGSSPPPAGPLPRRYARRQPIRCPVGRRQSTGDPGETLMASVSQNPEAVVEQAVAQPVLTPLTASAVILVLTIDDGGEQVVSDLLADLSGLARTVVVPCARRRPGCRGGRGIGRLGPPLLRTSSGRTAPVPGARRATGTGRWPRRVTSCSISGRRRWTSAGSWRRSWSAGWRVRPRWSTKSTGSSTSTSGTSSDSSTGRRTRPGQAAADAVTIGDGDPSFAGGTYVIVQKYLHDMAAWEALSVEEQERVIGRAKLSNVEMDDEVKPSNSHVALNTIVEPDGTQRQILRENMPFGSLGAGRVRHLLHRLRGDAVGDGADAAAHVPGRSARQLRPDPRFLDGGHGLACSSCRPRIFSTIRRRCRATTPIEEAGDAATGHGLEHPERSTGSLGIGGLGDRPS